MAVKTEYRFTLTDRIGSVVTIERIVWVIIGLGVLVRLAQFLANSSLWVDEAALAVSIIGIPYADLTKPLEFNTGSPLGFLVASKLSIQLFGSGEQALRLVPLLSGIGSIFLLYAVARHYIRPSAVPLALLLLATSTSVVRYSTFFRQYSSDMFIALLIILVQTYAMRSGLAFRWLITYTLLGAAAVWFSHPSVFVLAGMGGIMGANYLLQGNWRHAARVGAMSSAWLISFIASFKLTTVGDLATNEGVKNAISNYNSAFVPLFPTSLMDLQWYITVPFKLFDVPVGLPLTGLAAVLLLIGARAVFIKDSYKFFLLVSPMAILFLASAARLYPISDRWFLFLVPSVLMLIAEGAMSLYGMTKNATPLIGITLIGLLLLHPVASEAFHLVEPRGSERVRPALAHIQSRRTEGDALYIYSGGIKASTYYVDRFGMDDDEYTMGAHYVRDSSNAPRAAEKWGALELYTSEIDEFIGNNRVWILFSNVNTDNGINDETFLLHHLDGIGRRLETFRADNAVVYLYDLSGTQASTTDIRPGRG